MKRFLLLFALSLVLLLCACGQKGDATAATSSHMSLQSSPAAEEDNRQPPEPATGLEKPQPEAAEDPSLAVLRQDMGDNFCGIALLGRLPSPSCPTLVGRKSSAPPVRSSTAWSLRPLATS